MKRLIAAVFLTFGLLGGVAQAEYGFDASWSGMYGTGGYNLYGFGSDMYNLGGYMGGGYGGGYDSWYGSNWGGSCGTSFSGCSGGYDYANLGYSGYSMGYPSTDINILINIGYGGYGSYGGNSCGSTYSPYAPSSCGCSMGCSSTCGHSHQQPQWATTNYPNYYSQYPSMPLSPTLPSWPSMPNYSTFPSNPNIPGSNIFVNVSYPPSLPPWGGCGGVVQCPSGPVQPPTVQQPTYSYVPNTTSTPPVRFTVPRAVHSR